jgi:hypothetical protein
MAADVQGAGRGGHDGEGTHSDLPAGLLIFSLISDSRTDWHAAGSDSPPASDDGAASRGQGQGPRSKFPREPKMSHGQIQPPRAPDKEHACPLLTQQGDP